MTKMAKIDTLYKVKTVEKPYLWARKQLHSPFKEVAPTPHPFRRELLIIF